MEKQRVQGSKKIKNERPIKWKRNTQLRKDQQNRKLQKGGCGASRRPPFVVAAQRAAPILPLSFLNCVFFVHFRGLSFFYLFLRFRPSHFPLKGLSFFYLFLRFNPLKGVIVFLSFFKVEPPMYFMRGEVKRPKKDIFS